jgi:phosphatidylserine/phosphatidylglycerophosphate/cardiolipin synthase-like enzyme
LVEAIRLKAENGLTVAGVMEDQQVRSNIGTEYDPFKQAGLDVFIDGIEGQMHHKTMIIDERIVITGSYNFSRSAEIRNDENLIVIYSEEIADFYYARVPASLPTSTALSQPGGRSSNPNFQVVFLTKLV